MPKELNTLGHSIVDAIINTPGEMARLANAMISAGLVGGPQIPTGLGPSFLHVTPSGGGLNSGADWSNAVTAGNMNALILQAAGSGQTIALNADLGDYAMGAVNISNGGPDAAHPVTIRGYSTAGVPKMVWFVGNRTPWTAPVDPEQFTDVRGFGSVGGNGFTLLAGANNLVWDYVAGKQLASVFYCRASLSNVKFVHIGGYNVRRWFEMDRGSNAPTGFRFGDPGPGGTGPGGDTSFILGYSKQCFRAAGAGSDFKFYNIDADSGRQEGDNFPNGINFDDTFDGAYCYRFHGRRCGDRLATGAYWNGDGISAEYNNFHVLGAVFEECNPTGNLDGGFDIKGHPTYPAANILYKNCAPEDNAYNFKHWGATFQGTPPDLGRANHTISGGTSRNPHYRGGTQQVAHYEGENSSDMVIRDGHTYFDNNPACAVYNAPDTPVMFRVGSTVSGTTAGTLNRTHAGSVVLTGLNEADVTAPSLTSSLTPSFTENAPINYLCTSSEANSTFDIVGGADAALFVFNRVGGLLNPFLQTILTMTPKDFEAPVDAGANNVYDVQVRTRDPMRNQVVSNVALTITNLTETVTNAVRFGGASYLTRGANLTGVVDGSLGTYSEWVRWNGGDGVKQFLVVEHNGNFQIFKDTDNTIKVLLASAGAVDTFSFGTVNTYLSGAGYYVHIEASWDVNHAVGARLGQLRINGAPDFQILADTGNAFAVDYASSAPNWAVGAYDDGTFKITADRAYLWLDTTTRQDFTNPTVEAKFRNADGTQPSLGANGQTPTGTSPPLYLAGPAAGYATNKSSTGGGLTLTGSALTDSP